MTVTNYYIWCYVASFLSLIRTLYTTPAYSSKYIDANPGKWANSFLIPPILAKTSRGKTPFVKSRKLNIGSIQILPQSGGCIVATILSYFTIRWTENTRYSDTWA
jgi:hypothetical protein